MIRKVCAVCGGEYDYDLGQHRLRLIYCSPACAWSTEPRSRASMERELAAIQALIDAKPN